MAMFRLSSSDEVMVTVLFSLALFPQLADVMSSCIFCFHHPNWIFCSNKTRKSIRPSVTVTVSVIVEWISFRILQFCLSVSQSTVTVTWHELRYIVGTKPSQSNITWFDWKKIYLPHVVELCNLLLLFCFCFCGVEIAAILPSCMSPMPCNVM